MVKFRTMTVNHTGSSVSVAGKTPISIFAKIQTQWASRVMECIKRWYEFCWTRIDVPGYADQLQGETAQILKLKPGVTGQASMKYSNEDKILALQPDSIKYNNEIIYPDKVRINLEYLNHQSFLLDLKIIIYTILGKKMWNGPSVSDSIYENLRIVLLLLVLHVRMYM